MTTFFAQPYDISATGFYFDTFADYETKAEAARNSYGEPVEEFEIQFIDGEVIDCELAKAFCVSRPISPASSKSRTIGMRIKNPLHHSVGECGYDTDSDPDDLDIDLYEIDSLKDLAEQFVEEGLFGDIPERIACYLDYDLIARELGCDYTETTVAGRRIVYRCG